ncbi:TRAP-type C4-dicarboxylate transport system permease small subunit [Lysinibacillus composti]|uniref:TRAP transporter small permease n=1 Tax=Lysinibacillus composti TaxID=720633 RepID=A0A3N9UBX2_9BACI|nr:TRAP transporter small permease [Lysinibacillus composti]MBM7609514.1 TRAP-type C4-dicarboxylate transport system permease small subunit [Lysinibacillus composti]RQW73857.1 TRAP transporter small permease [Lysinibacillus composti]
MSALYKAVDGLIKFAGIISGILIILTTIMTCYEVVSRSFFDKPTSWATELSVYAVIASCFLGSAYAIRTYSHITVDLIINLVSYKGKVVLGYLTSLLGLLFTSIFTFYSLHHVMNTYEIGTTSASLLRIPMYIPEMALPIGGFLMSLAFILQIIDGKAHQGGDHL